MTKRWRTAENPSWAHHVDGEPVKGRAMKALRESVNYSHSRTEQIRWQAQQARPDVESMLSWIREAEIGLAEARDAGIVAMRHEGESFKKIGERLNITGEAARKKYLQLTTT